MGTVFVITTLLAISTGIYARNLTYFPSNPREAMLKELAVATQQDAAVVFVHFDWCFLDRERQNFGEFATRYNHDSHKPLATFHVINFTDGVSPLRELPGWKENDPGPNGEPINGYGEVVWIRRGRIISIKPIGHFRSTADVINHTKAALTELERAGDGS